MNRHFDTINIDAFGYNSVEKPDDCIDYQSDALTFDFLGENKKILLRIVSKFDGNAHNVGKELYEQD